MSCSIFWMKIKELVKIRHEKAALPAMEYRVAQAQAPEGKLKAAIISRYESVENFKVLFLDAAEAKKKC